MKKRRTEKKKTGKKENGKKENGKKKKDEKVYHTLGLYSNSSSSTFSAGRPSFSNISLNTALYSSSGIFFPALALCIKISARTDPELPT